MNAREQRIGKHAHRMRSNYIHRQIIDLEKREKVIRKDLEDVLKKQGYFEPNTPGSP